MVESKTALITGGSSGIGFDLARVFGKNGYDLVIVARDSTRLITALDNLRREFPNTDVRAFSQDLSERDAAEKVHVYIKNQHIEVDTLVNNAGYGEYGEFAERPLENHLALINTNFITPVALTRMFLEEMIERGSGKVLNVASTAAFQPGPLMSLYHSTKSGMVSWSLAIAEELKPRGVTVSVLCPGLTETDFFNRPTMQHPLSPRWLMMSPIRVAEAGFEGLNKGESLIIPGAANKIIYSIGRLIPPVRVARSIFNKRQRS